MAHWLYKSEPASWSWEQQKAAGEKGTEWTGVRNYLARNNMRAMQIGDKGFFYHSNDGLEIVGIVEVSALSQPDSTAKGDPKWDCVPRRHGHAEAGDAEGCQGERKARQDVARHLHAPFRATGDG
ncbi:putative RNA-binding protein with PUA-like domain [Rhizobium sp. BK619]|nr:putative RNA-binding protein with PUA-like domain [Rhizobium sp. BK619]